MELLFNLVWLFLSLALLASMHRRCARSQRSARALDSFHRYLTVVVLSFMLLPVISMTDDLHAMTTMAEGERTDRKISAAQNPHLQDHPLFHPAYTTASLPVEYCSGCYEIVSPTCLLPVIALRPTRLHSDRAPPKK